MFEGTRTVYLKVSKAKKDFSFPPRPAVLRFFFFYIYNLKGFLLSVFLYLQLQRTKRSKSYAFLLSLSHTRTRTRTQTHSRHSHSLVLFTRSVIIELCVELFTIFTEYFSLNIQSILVYITQQFNKRVFKIPCKDELQEIAQPNSTQIVPFPSFFSFFKFKKKLIVIALLFS